MKFEVYRASNSVQTWEREFNSIEEFMEFIKDECPPDGAIVEYSNGKATIIIYDHWVES